MSDINYWVVTASADHAARGLADGIVQAGHGKDAPLRRMQPGDGVVIYSPRATYPDGPALQAFTLIGRVGEGEPYQGDQYGHLMWRRDVRWQEGRIALIRPLLAELEVTRGLKSWGMAFRYGVTKITKLDFARIARAMVAGAIRSDGGPRALAPCQILPPEALISGADALPDGA